MINTSLDIIIKCSDEFELKLATENAVLDARRVLFDAFSNGDDIPDEQIVSSTKKIPNTMQLAFCKFFKASNIHSLQISYREFIVEIYKIYIKKDSVRTDDLSCLIPNFFQIRHRLSGVFIRQIVRGFGIMLVSLWKSDAIVLSSVFKLPSSKNAEGGKIILCSHIYTEVLAFFNSYRQQTLGGGSTKLKVTEGLTPSLQANLQHHGWRLIIATDWHKIEDVCVYDSVKFLKAISDHKAGRNKFIPHPVPVRDMLSMLIDNFGDRVRFTIDDFLVARNDVFEKNLVIENYSPETLYNGPWNSEIPMFDLKSSSKIWARTQESFIKARQKKGIQTYDSVKNALSKLNKYLFFILPDGCHRAGLPISIPEKPSDFTRKYIDGGTNAPSFLDYIGDDKSSSTTYNLLRNIDEYFIYLETLSRIDKDVDGFINPLIRQIDFPLVHRPTGTVKTIVSQKHLPTMLAFLYAVENLLWHIIETLINCESQCETQNRIRLAINRIPAGYDNWINTEEIGYVPFIYYKNKAYPIKYIHKSVLSLSKRKVFGHGYIKLPNINYLIQFILAFETGIRNIHIKWLDADYYDKHIDRSHPLQLICKLHVSSDKVKEKPWDAYVSYRVIQLLDKLKYLRDKYDEPWISERYWYSGHKESRFGKLKPLFSRGGNSSFDGKPYDDGTHIENFRKLLIAFQDFCNDKNLFSEVINLAGIELSKDSNGNTIRIYKSDVTPHSARATVVSHHIRILPAKIIGNYITGHETEQTVAYYTVVDPEYLRLIEQGQALAVAGLNPLLGNPEEADAIHAEAHNSALQAAINISMRDAFTEFGATAFERESPSGKYESGLSIALETGTDQLAHNSTHICPYNNLCPDQVRLEHLEKQCGQCWASIKTVDHLPRIEAHIRSLNAKINEKSDTIKILVRENSHESVLEQLENDRDIIAKEESAWIATAVILEEFRLHSGMRQSYLAGKPEIIEKHLERIATERSPLTDILIRVRDAKSYPEYFTPQLKASLIPLRDKILMQSGDIDRALNKPTDYLLLDEFRGIIRSICDASGKSIEDIGNIFNTELPARNNISFLEIM